MASNNIAVRIVHDTTKLLEALRTCIELPEHIIDVTVSAGLDKVTTVTCTFHPVAPHDG